MIAFSASDDIGIISIDSVQAYACWANKEIMHRKVGVKCNNVIKHYRKWLTMTLQKKT